MSGNKLLNLKSKTEVKILCMHTINIKLKVCQFALDSALPNIPKFTALLLLLMFILFNF